MVIAGLQAMPKDGGGDPGRRGLLEMEVMIGLKDFTERS